MHGARCHSYLHWKKTELGKLLRQLGLPYTGTKEKLALRLNRYDETQ